MPARSSETSNTDPAAFLLNILYHFNNGKVDWAGVAAENGITHARNVTPKLNSMAKPYGYRWEQGRLIKLDEKDGVVPATPVAKKGKGKGSGATDGPRKKRKVEKTSAEDDVVSYVEAGDGDDHD